MLKCIEKGYQIYKGDGICSKEKKPRKVSLFSLGNQRLFEIRWLFVNMQVVEDKHTGKKKQPV